MPLLSETRSAKAAAAVCLVLACAALVGITEIVSHGRAVAQDTIATAHPILPMTPTEATNPSDAGKPPDQSIAAGEAVIVLGRQGSHSRQLMGTNNTFSDGGDKSTSR